MSAVQHSGRSRASLDESIERLRTDLRRLASLVDMAIDRSVASLARLDERAARQVIADDAAVNQLRYSIEQDAVHLIATQQPIASDLRFIIAVLAVVSLFAAAGWPVPRSPFLRDHSLRSPLEPRGGQSRRSTSSRRLPSAAPRVEGGGPFARDRWR